ncbi:hypothetical protein MKW98_004908 [Papaver atlanticum]|uniref:N-acetyltransferase domain-containing protein n=1 Tax=Papaver atlanticum TaxID=357466 RepID=A0AAD4XEK0_9MAGN|nr:hypothetical protein MKW98_004908 [Papaver atlanticum]
MLDIRQATMNDIPGIRACNFQCFPMEDRRDSCYYEKRIVSWPQLSYVAEDYRTGPVLPTHRRQGIAKKLITAAQNAMVGEYGSEYVSLYALNLFTESLGYKIQETAAEFYDNGEDAYVMEKKLPRKTSGSSWA